MKIKKKKCFKVNIYILLIFQRKQVLFFVKMKKYQYFATNIFSSEKCDFFGDFGQKTGRAGLIMLKLSTKRNQVFLKKKKPR